MVKGSAGRSVLSRAMQILRAFDLDATFLTISQLSQRSGLPLATTHRLVGELEAFGLLERHADRTYRIGVGLWEIACRTPGILGLREIAMPYLNRVQSAVGHHTQLGILQGREVLFLERLSSKSAVVNHTLIGGRAALHASSSGLVLLAGSDRELQEEILRQPLHAYTAATPTDPGLLRKQLDAIRRDGYAAGNGYIHPEARGIAVPVAGVDKTVVAALGVVVPNDETPVAPAVRVLREAAGQISNALRAAYLDKGGH